MLQKLFMGGNYSKAETIWGNTVATLLPYGQNILIISN